jgi:hypothetical protein
MALEQRKNGGESGKRFALPTERMGYFAAKLQTCDGLEFLGLAAGHFDLEAAFEFDEIAFIGPRRDGLNELQVDDLPAVGAKENSEIEAGLQVGQGA